MNELQEKIESSVITRTFCASGMPESVFKEINDFCKAYYGDSRWVMIADLKRMADEDVKFYLLYDIIEVLKQRVTDLENKSVEKKVDPFAKTFGQRKVRENE